MHPVGGKGQVVVAPGQAAPSETEKAVEGDYAGNGLRYGALPRYPGSARRAGREGVVTVRVLVGADGNAASVTVRQRSGREDFDDAAVQAVKKWRFSPARRGKEPVASFHDVRIRFRLDEAALRR